MANPFIKPEQFARELLSLLPDDPAERERLLRAWIEPWAERMNSARDQEMSGAREELRAHVIRECTCGCQGMMVREEEFENRMCPACKVWIRFNNAVPGSIGG